MRLTAHLIRIVSLAAITLAPLASQAQEKDPPGIVIAKSPDPQNMYVASPSIVILPDSSYLVSHDWSGPATKGITRTSVYRSADKGLHWQRIADVDGLRWATLFLHRDNVYLIGVNRSYGDIHILRSADGGHSWTKPTERSGILFKGGYYHTGPVPVVVHNGRIWRAFEEKPAGKNEDPIGAFVISAPESSDLLLPESWTRTMSVVFSKKWINARNPATIEGNVVIKPDGTVANLIRMETHPGKSDAFELDGYAKGIPRFEVAPLMDVSADGKRLSFTPETGFVHFPGAESKFTIRYDSVSGRYWTIANKITKMHPDTDFNISPHRQRNVLSLFSSPDLKTWTEQVRVLRWKEGTIQDKMAPVGFQYVDWQFEGKDLVFVCRTGWFGKRSHDANYITFHRLTDFRNLTMADSGPDLGE
ncbi:MAG: sialidase family protein [Chitinophagaceae bacterium]